MSWSRYWKSSVRPIRASGSDSGSKKKRLNLCQRFELFQKMLVSHSVTVYIEAVELSCDWSHTVINHSIGVHQQFRGRSKRSFIVPVIVCYYSRRSGLFSLLLGFVEQTADSSQKCARLPDVVWKSPQLFCHLQNLNVGKKKKKKRVFCGWNMWRKQIATLKSIVFLQNYKMRCHSNTFSWVF